MEIYIKIFVKCLIGHCHLSGGTELSHLTHITCHPYFPFFISYYVSCLSFLIKKKLLQNPKWVLDWVELKFLGRHMIHIVVIHIKPVMWLGALSSWKRPRSPRYKCFYMEQKQLWRVSSYLTWVVLLFLLLLHVKTLHLLLTFIWQLANKGYATPGVFNYLIRSLCVRRFLQIQCTKNSNWGCFPAPTGSTTSA